MVPVSHAYLLLSLLLSACFMLCLIVCPRQSRLATCCALMTTPFAFTSLLAVPDYWDPPKLGTILETGIEDVLVTLACCGIPMVLALKTIHPRIDIMSPSIGRAAIIRYLTISLVGLAIGLTSIHIIGLPVSTAGLATNTVMAMGLLATRPFLWPAALTGALSLALVYTLTFASILQLSPDFIHTWNPHALWGISFFSIPCEEVLWALTTGAVVPLYFGLILPLEPSPKGRVTAGFSSTDSRSH
ncbi:MAG: hypothetical protein KJO21_02660 [Verrucomicrobiae bacterium]|nr:hypothetical protein [Verrucomicrobiae bacterium]NNJ44201.1 hypothetical protein [Akkermansiaceae bacterium]